MTFPVAVDLSRIWSSATVDGRRHSGFAQGNTFLGYTR
jgi:hypothetical protein